MLFRVYKMLARKKQTIFTWWFTFCSLISKNQSAKNCQKCATRTRSKWLNIKCFGSEYNTPEATGEAPLLSNYSLTVQHKKQVGLTLQSQCNMGSKVSRVSVSHTGLQIKLWTWAGDAENVRKVDAAAVEWLQWMELVQWDIDRRLWQHSTSPIWRRSAATSTLQEPDIWCAKTQTRSNKMTLAIMTVWKKEQ